MNVVKEINAINQRELDLGLTASWHDDYKDSARIFAGNLHKDLTEGDVITIFSQYGEIMDIHMPRDKETGAPKGFAFLMYEDQRSTVLAVDNLNGAKVLERTLRVDHVRHYHQPRYKNDEGEWVEPDEESMNAKPEMIVEDGGDESDSSDSSGASIDPEDPMRDYLLAKRREEKEARKLSGGVSSKKKKSKTSKTHKNKDETPEERAARKARKREKKLKKEKKKASKSEGMKAVENLLKGLGTPDMGRRGGNEDADDNERRRSAQPHRSDSRHRSNSRSRSPHRDPRAGGSRPSERDHRERDRDRHRDYRRRSPSPQGDRMDVDSRRRPRREEDDNDRRGPASPHSRSQGNGRYRDDY